MSAARLERQRSDRLRKEALAIARDLEQIREQNHFAESLRRLMGGRA